MLPLEKVQKQAVRCACRVRWDKPPHICCFNCHTLLSPLATLLHITANHCNQLIASLSAVVSLHPPFSIPIPNPYLQIIFSYLDRVPFSGTNSSQVFVIFIFHYLLPFRQYCLLCNLFHPAMKLCIPNSSSSLAC